MGNCGTVYQFVRNKYHMKPVRIQVDKNVEYYSLQPV